MGDKKVGIEITAIRKLILDNPNLIYQYFNVEKEFVQVPVVASDSPLLPAGIVFPEDEPGELEVGWFFAVAVDGVYSNFIEGQECKAGGRWYKTPEGWEYKPHYWDNPLETGYIKGIAGEVISFFTPVYIGADGKIYKYTAIAALQNKVVGIAKSSADQDAEIVIMLEGGKIKGCAGLSPGEKYYSNADAQIVLDIPENGVSHKLGLALSNTEFLVQLGPSILLI